MTTEYKANQRNVQMIWNCYLLGIFLARISRRAAFWNNLRSLRIRLWVNTQGFYPKLSLRRTSDLLLIGAVKLIIAAQRKMRIFRQRAKNAKRLSVTVTWK